VREDTSVRGNSSRCDSISRPILHVAAVDSNENSEMDVDQEQNRIAGKSDGSILIFLSL